MDSLNMIFTFIGVVAIVFGIYIFISKRLYGRKLDGVSKEKILKFVPYEAATYVLLGILMILQGQEQNIPFMHNGVVVIILMIVAVAIIAANVYFSNKILGPVHNTLEDRHL